MPSKLRRYQTLSEHVSHPNLEPPLRESFICPNGCHNGFYGVYGAHYGSMEEYPLWYAVNSFSWQLENWDRWNNTYNFYELMALWRSWIKKVKL